MNLRPALASFALVPALFVAGCDNAPAPGASSASAAAKSSAPAASAKPSAAASAKAAPTASAAASAAAGAEPKEITPEDLAKLLKLPDGAKKQKVPGLEGFEVSAPDGVKIAVAGANREKKWGTLTSGANKGAILIANHEQDDGEKCMKLADAKAKLAGAKIVKELAHTSQPKEAGGKNTDWGEAIELVVFERDGKQGFYAHKEFNHGDDSTHVCCAAGAPGDVAELKGVGEPAQNDALSSICLSMTFTF